jgi:hypothetical protein
MSFFSDNRSNRAINETKKKPIPTFLFLGILVLLFFVILLTIVMTFAFSGPFLSHELRLGFFSVVFLGLVYVLVQELLSIQRGEIIFFTRYSGITFQLRKSPLSFWLMTAIYIPFLICLIFASGHAIYSDCKEIFNPSMHTSQISPQTSI